MGRLPPNKALNATGAARPRVNANAFDGHDKGTRRSMSGLLTWALATAVGTGVFIAILAYAARRTRRRHGAWRCPACGQAFGDQPERQWFVRIDPIPGAGSSRGGANFGPLLKCAPCGREYWFGEDGRLAEDVRTSIRLLDPDCRRTSR